MQPRRVLWPALALVAVATACSPNSDAGSTTVPSTAPATETTGAPTSTPAPTTTAPVAPPNSLTYVDEEESVLAVFQGRDDTTRFTELAAALGDDEVFRQERGVTLLVPVDSAWEGMSDEEWDGLVADPTAVALLLSEHLAIGTVTLDALVEQGAMSNAMGRQLAVDENGGAVTIGGATVVEADLEASNGVVHLIDAVLEP